MEQQIYWPYNFDEEVMDTEWWKFFISLYQMLNTANLLNKTDTCISILQAMADFLQECVADSQEELANECVEYLSEMPGDWMKKLVLYFVHN